MELENQELILLELEGTLHQNLYETFAQTCVLHLEFNKKNENEISSNLENFIEFVSKTGTTIFPWNIIRNLYLCKVKHVIDNFSNETQSNTSNDEIKERIIERLKSFPNAPFTIQRVSELLVKPKSNYNRKEKYLTGLEKCIMVVTCMDPHGKYIYS